MWLATMTRPDLSFAMSASPSTKHWGATKRAMRCLAGTPRYGIHFMEWESELIAFSDTDWAGCHVTQASTTGLITLYDNGPVSWRSEVRRNIYM
ncbi:MAG: hypothetical protein BJ554DRAFT_5997 [Olpidium bornovanus]|uniref:Uncharacterized protein n=1 Tax=Olpidium bornovanus TaxID=278681 RepID=A0A8H7ZYH9_9FUNG|nr:MAG: hypothetical protein BJ554DRAFT_5997 [Olpidium bornovanus]